MPDTNQEPMTSERDQFKLRRRRESVTAKEIIAWMRTKRSWQWAASINDINRALDEICPPMLSENERTGIE